MKLAAVPPPILTQETFRQLYDEHAGRLCAFLSKSLNGNQTEAEGITQEAFLKAWTNRATLRDLKAFKSWLYTIALNELRQRKRKLRPLAVESIESPCERPGPERQAAGREDLARINDALAELPDDQREAILLVRVENLKFREAADVLGVPENTVKTRVRRGLLQLAEALDL